ncbi:MAG: 1-acyl-sn-glycerol-3-phosphate acyltransferase, partial [Pseudomonadota bacterium]
MTITWDGGPPPRHDPPGVMGWLRILRRALLIVATILLGLAVLLPLRLIERPLFGLHRPWTAWVIQGVQGRCSPKSGRSIRRKGSSTARPSR